MKLQKWLESISERMSELALKIEANVKTKTPEYYMKLEPLVKSPLIIDDDIHLNLNKISQLEKKKQTLFISHLSVTSDICLSLLIHNQSNSKCNKINDMCIAFLIDDASAGYYLTHQLAYLIISKNVKFLNKSVPKYQFAAFIATNYPY